MGSLVLFARNFSSIFSPNKIINNNNGLPSPPYQARKVQLGTQPRKKKEKTPPPKKKKKKTPKKKKKTTKRQKRKKKRKRKESRW